MKSQVYDCTGREIKLGDIISNSEGDVLVVGYEYGAFGADIVPEFAEKYETRTGFYPFINFIGFRRDYYHGYFYLMNFKVVGKA